MKKLKLIETFSTNNIELVKEPLINESLESDSRVDGKYIIGMIEGQFFKPDGMSRNKRWYPRQLWEKALNCLDVKNRFGTSTMFGEIGHSDGPVEDMTLRNGCASHFVDKMWIDDKGRGMGRAYILNTPTGNLLKTYLGAGCKLKVSTRGEGLFLEGETHDGCPIVDPDSYELQTADFVLNPGFIETSANLKEEYNQINDQIKNNKSKIEETIEYVKKEGEKRMSLDIEAYVGELKEELKAIKAENKSLNEQLQAKEKELLQKQFNESAEVKKLNEELAPYKKLTSSAKSLKETFEKSQELLKKERAEKTAIKEELESYKAKCGTLEEVQEATELSTKSLKMIEEYRKFGTPSDIQCLAEQATKMLDKVKASKKSDSVSRGLLESYKKLGTPADIRKLMKNADSMLSDMKESVELEANVRKLMEEVKEGRRLATNSKKLLEEVKQSRELERVCEKALESLKAYKAKFGSLKEEKTEVNEEKTVVVDEALDLSKKHGCTVESAAKLIKENGVEGASKILESVEQPASVKTSLKEGKELVEEAANLDNKAVEKSTNEFLKDGMIKNYFNQASLGIKTKYDLNKVDPDANLKQCAAKELLKKYADKIEVEKALKVEAPATAEDAEKEVKKLAK